MFEEVEKTMQIFATGMVETRALLHTVVAAQANNQEDQAKLSASIDEYINASRTFIEATTAYVESSKAYVESSQARIERLEANLDTLIRAITSEHTNGKKP